MSSLLASPLYVYRRAIPSTLATRQWQRASMNFWFCIRHEPVAPKFINFKDVTVPDIESQQISLWSKEDHLGIMPVKKVIDEYLSPGTMLSLRGDPPPKDSNAGFESYDYELRRLKLKPDSAEKPRHPHIRTQKAMQFHMDAFTTPGRLQKLLERAYGFLDPRTGPGNLPVEFYVTLREMPEHVDLSNFTMGRVDLHPSVILGALPKGAFQVVRPKSGLQHKKQIGLRGAAVWLVAPKGLRMGPVTVPSDPHKAARMVEDIVIKKRKHLEELKRAKDVAMKEENDH